MIMETFELGHKKIALPHFFSINQKKSILKDSNNLMLCPTENLKITRHFKDIILKISFSSLFQQYP
jgi:hypothetical protein